MSRFLNPGDLEDREYLMGLPAGMPRSCRATRPGSASGCGSRTTRTRRCTPADVFTIVDTEENEFRPIPLDDTNVFAFRPTPLGARRGQAAPDSAAASGPIQGSLILFKLPTDRCRTGR